MTVKLLMFKSATTATEAVLPAPEKVLSGAPKQTIRNHFSEASNQFFAGEWTGDIGKWQVRYSEDEFCYVTRGVVIVTDADGISTRVTAGDAFMVPAGFAGTWDVIEPVHKFYVIYERKSLT